MPAIYIIAGPNGAGKTTAAFNLLPEIFDTVEFVNADEIARGLSPFNFESVTYQAGRIMIERIDQLLKEKKSFAIETTLSGVIYLQFVKQAKLAGYNILLFFIWLENFQLAKRRVAERVRKGGHNIPPDVIERRYEKGIENFYKYASMADDWYVYDNSGPSYLSIAKAAEQPSASFNQEYAIRLPAVNAGNHQPDLSDKIRMALDKSIQKVIAEEKARDGYLVVSDKKGGVIKIAARDL